MQCREAQELLSAYYDGELSAETRSTVVEHVRSCPHCRDELALFGELSAMAKGLDDPEPPPQIWAEIEAALDGRREDAPAVRPLTRSTRPARKRRLAALATAALVMIATGVVWFVSRPAGHGALAADFGEYLEHFSSNPDEAQEVLLAKYDGQAVDLSEATRRLGYRPAVADGLPDRYTLEGIYVLEMPCCTCVQTICRRDDGQVFAIFEHGEQQPAWFGNCPRIDAQCNGRQCSVIQAEHGLVASWEANQRQITLVGARDLEEIADLVGHLQGGKPKT